MDQQTKTRLKSMRLGTMVQEIERQECFGTSLDMSFDERIALVVDKQWEKRLQNRLERNLKNAVIPNSSACLSETNYTKDRGFKKSKIVQIGSCSWISTHLNLIITGPTGVGKSFFCSALGHEASVQGFKVKYYKTTRLVNELNLGLANAKYEKILAELKKIDLLILDDFGIEVLSSAASRDLLEVIDDRYNESKSTIFSSQLPVNKWLTIFKDKTIADALLDRSVYKSMRLELEGPSMREYYDQIKVTEYSKK
jgi:DNA replication protein DnaC